MVRNASRGAGIGFDGFDQSVAQWAVSPDARAPGKRLFDAIGSQLVLHRLGGDAPRVGEAYVIEEILGAGGFGLICRATQCDLRRSVALKLHALGGAADAGVREALREARSLARLEHPGIVAVHAVGESELIATEPLACAYVEMQLIEGQTFGTWRRSETPSAAQLVRVVVQAARAVAYAHEQGVLHRDLKPDNVMVDATGRARVIDFGLALATDDVTTDRALAAWDGGPDALGTRATATGLVRGTPGYMAPEASQGQPLAASDQFALAVMLHEALTGRHPMMPTPDAERAEPAPGERIRGRIDPVLARAMAVVVSDRFESVGSFCDALEAALRPRRAPWIAAAAVLAVGTTATAAWLGMDVDPPVVSAAPSTAVTAAQPTPDLPHAQASSPELADPIEEPRAVEPLAPDIPLPQPPADTVVAPSAELPSVAGAPSCEDLAAWSGIWQVGARVLWTEFAYQLETNIDYTLDITVEPRCALTLAASKYPALVEGEPRLPPVLATAQTTALLQGGTGWRVPMRLAFEGDSRTYAAEEHHMMELRLDHDPSGRPRLRGAFNKETSTGFVLRSGVLLGARTMAPATIPTDELSCASRCMVECGGARSRQRCRERECQPWDERPQDICGPPSFDFLPPLRARASRRTVMAGESPLAKGLARGHKARQLASCADNARHLGGRWAVWRIPSAAGAVASQLTMELSATGCTLAGTAQAASPAEPIALTGEVTAAGTWVLTPTTPAPWFPEPFILAGVGPHAPAFGVDAATPMHRLRALRLDP